MPGCPRAFQAVEECGEDPRAIRAPPCAGSRRRVSGGPGRERAHVSSTFGCYLRAPVPPYFRLARVLGHETRLCTRTASHHVRPRPSAF